MQSMQEHDTFPGKVYAVTCASGCTITDNKGRTLGECEAGKQTLVIATSDKLMTSADALVTATFNSAPAKLRLLGLLGGGEATGGALPAGYLAAEFLEGTGYSSRIDVSEFFCTSDDEFEWCVKFDKYPEGVAGTFGVWSGQNYNYARHIVSMPSRDNAFNFFGPETKISNIRSGVFKMNKNGVFFNGELRATFKTLTISQNKGLYLFTQRVNGTYYPAPVALSYFRVKNKLDLVPALGPQGAPCMFDKVTKQPFYNSRTGQFVVGMTMNQALKLSTLPATGGTLTISLPTGYEADAGVATALETARANGWTITVQTYEAETAAATFGMRRIWVRKTQDENGAYIDADGARWHVDWCVDMLTPDGSTPDAHGYELFRSVDAAAEYWGLEPWVAPEQEELLTEY